MPAEIDRAAQFVDDPRGWQRRWTLEFEAARKSLEKWHEQAAEAVKQYSGTTEDKGSRLELFPANIDMREAMLYGQTPRIDARRRYSDAQDDDARVGAEMLDRLLNSDCERDDDDFRKALRLALKDWLLVDCGNVRMRYVAEFEQVPEQPAQTETQVDPATGLESVVELAPAVPAHERKTFEDVETIYVHWRDQLWPSSRVFGEVPWWAFKAEMTRDAFAAKFGEDLAKTVPVRASRSDKPPAPSQTEENDPWARVAVWEIWEKEGRRLWFYVEGFTHVIAPLGVAANENGSIPDPLGLDGFWPFPEPLVSNVTTDAFVPRPAWCRSQDLHREINRLQQRKDLLTDAIRVAGVYDKNCGSLKQLLDGKAENVLIPVDSWAAFAEKGGLKGQMELLPLDTIVAALDRVTQKQAEAINLLHQVEGQSDIERGQATSKATATEQAAKVRFSNVRSQRSQDVFAEFATKAQKIRAEIVSKHFDPQTIIQRSNMAQTVDAPRAMKAAQLIKDELSKYRINVSSESVSMTDFASLKQERGELMAALSGFMQAAPLFAQAMGPQGMATLLEIIKWAIAGFRGASTIEAVLDQAVDAAKQMASQPKPPPPPDPRMQLAVQKGQLDLQKGKMDIAATQAKTQATIIGAKAEIAKTQMDMQAKQQEAALAPLEAHMWGANRGLVPENGGMR